MLRMLARALVFLLLPLVLPGCGHKGPLYIEPDEPAAEPEAPAKKKPASLDADHGPY